LITSLIAKNGNEQLVVTTLEALPVEGLIYPSGKEYCVGRKAKNLSQNSKHIFIITCLMLMQTTI